MEEVLADEKVVELDMAEHEVTVGDKEFEFDYADYDGSFGNIFKHCWICFQVAYMTIFMIIGAIGYRKVNKGWSKVKSLFCIQLVIIFYLLINEFTDRNFRGIFFILLGAQWSYFITFSLVIDSCITIEADENINQDKLKTFNWYFRLVNHLLTLGLFTTIFYVTDCNEKVYPPNFTLLIFLILLHQVYDVYLKLNDYMIDWEELPFTSINKLRYNRELFEKQAKCLLYGNFIFAVVSIAIICFGVFVINEQEKNEHLLCYSDTEWIYMSWEGNVFGTLM